MSSVGSGIVVQVRLVDVRILKSYGQIFEHEQELLAWIIFLVGVIFENRAVGSPSWSPSASATCRLKVMSSKYFIQPAQMGL